MLFWWQNLLAALSRKKYYYDDDEDAIQNVAKGDDKSRRTTDTKTSVTSLGPIDEKEDYPPSRVPGDKEKIDASSPGGDQQKLARVLGLVDLTMLGVGATLGVGVYVLAGSVARNQAGPSVVVSFAIAAMASLFSGFCYSEFASRISKSGSAYNYTYLSIGEFAAYIIGWNLVLEYIIGTASEAKAIANQIDSLLGNAYQDAMTRWLPIRSSFLSSYPDFIAPIFVFLITALLSWGARESTKVNNVLTFVNLGTVGVIVFSGLFRINPANWSIRKSDIPPNARAGSGGFAPFGLTGIVTGAAKCFFGFVGFDGIATTGEETHNPKRNIPLAIILSLLIVFVCYFSIAVVITMVLPYYEQNPDAPFPAIFDRLGWPLMKWAVTTGSLIALFTAMFGAFFPLPRILFAMSRDGLLYKPFSYVSPKTKTPIISTAVSGVITAVMSAVFKLDQLVDMMSIGTLLAYIIVAVCVLMLRYSDDELENDIDQTLANSDADYVYVETLGTNYNESGDKQSFSCSNACQTGSTLMNAKTLNQPRSELHLSSCHLTENMSKEFNSSYPAMNTIGCKSVTSDAPFSNHPEGIGNTQNGKPMYYGVESLENPKYFTKRNPPYNLNVKCRSKFRRILMNLFNTEGHTKVTRSSQSVSKVCIHILVFLTIGMSFLLNSATHDNEGTDTVPPTPMAQQASSLNTSEIRLPSSLGGPNVVESIPIFKDSTNKTGEAGLIDNNAGRSPLTAGETSTVERTFGQFFHTTLSQSRPLRYFQESTPWHQEVSQKLKYLTYSISAVAYLATFIVLARQGQNKSRLNFKVPFVPLLPCVSIFMNVYLMINLDVSTWVRFLVWLVVGVAVYFSYSIFHSKQKSN